jgi:hypothetical protein
MAMILPKGRAAYENLNTSFIDFDELVEDLRANSFTGYVEVSFWGYEGVLFMDSGSIVNAVEEIDSTRTTGQGAVIGIMQQAQEKNGSVSVYPLPAEMVTMLASVLRSEVVHSDLNTDFTDLGQLVAKLQSEGHTGYLEMTMRGGVGTAMILMRSGEVVESILSSGTEVLSGIEVARRIIERASSLGAVFNVYRTSVEEAFQETAEIMAGLDLPESLAVWQSILAAVESVVDGKSSHGSFLDTFKDVLVDKAEEYPFLDPFAGDFQYGEGLITYQGPASKDFNPALAGCLNATLARVAESLPKENLLADVRDALSSVVEEHPDAIRKFGMRPLMSDLFAEE